MATTAVQIEPDSDSGLGETSEDDTDTLSPSLLQGVFEHGRRYHHYEGAGYPFPNDEAEQRRLNFQHSLFKRLLCGKLHLAPVQDPLNVLDLGSGTGAWAIEFAEKNPNAHVRGVDISPIQPGLVPLNCAFEIDDYNKPWTFKTKHDFTFMRLPFGSIEDPAILAREAFANLSPGGFFEIQDTSPPISDDGTIHGSSPLRLWKHHWCDALGKQSRDPYLIQKLEKIMIEAGFVSVQSITIKVPQNPWPEDKEMKIRGALNMVNVLEGIEGFSLRPFIDGLKWSQTEVAELLVEVEQDICDSKIHAYWPFTIIHGQKPRGQSSSCNDNDRVE